MIGRRWRVEIQQSGVADYANDLAERLLRVVGIPDASADWIFVGEVVLHEGPANEDDFRRIDLCVVLGEEPALHQGNFHGGEIAAADLGDIALVFPAERGRTPLDKKPDGAAVASRRNNRRGRDIYHARRVAEPLGEFARELIRVGILVGIVFIVRIGGIR